MRPGRPGSVLAIGLLVAVIFSYAAPATSADAVPKTDEEKTLYFMGVFLGKNAAWRYSPRPDEIPMIEQGLVDALEGDEMKLDESVYGPKLNELARVRMAEAVDRQKAAGKTFLDQFATQKGAVRTESGLVFLETTPGGGAQPTESSAVTAHYHGTFTDGSVFDSSIERGKPAEFKLSGVIPCWREALQRMKVGGKAKFACPSDLAYGDRGAPPGIPGGATLVFEVELISVK